MKVPDYCELIIRRANGEIETVNFTELMKESEDDPFIIRHLNHMDFCELRDAFKSLGREVIGYRNIEKEI